MAADGALRSTKPRVFGPRAVQSWLEEQATELRTWVPPFTVRCCQVAPESSVVKMVAPTAMQRVEVGHVTAASPGTPSGIEALDHVAPASADTKIFPL